MSATRLSAMTKYVDHEARREELALIAAGIVARDGLDALTFRRVAAEAGASTTILTHYFSDKKQLLLATFRIGAERAAQRFDEARRNGGGLRECLETILPLDTHRRDEWRVRTCFWGLAVGDPALVAEERQRVRSAHRRVESLLADTYAEARDRDIAAAARRLLTLVHGLGARNAVDPSSWPPAEQRRLLAEELNALAGFGLVPRPADAY
jgi:AcrR family transcriptional regulator